MHILQIQSHIYVATYTLCKHRYRWTVHILIVYMLHLQHYHRIHLCILDTNHNIQCPNSSRPELPPSLIRKSPYSMYTENNTSLCNPWKIKCRIGKNDGSMFTLSQHWNVLESIWSDKARFNWYNSQGYVFLIGCHYRLRKELLHTWALKCHNNVFPSIVVHFILYFFKL